MRSYLVCKLLILLAQTSLRLSRKAGFSKSHKPSISGDYKVVVADDDPWHPYVRHQNSRLEFPA